MVFEMVYYLKHNDEYYISSTSLDSIILAAYNLEKHGNHVSIEITTDFLNYILIYNTTKHENYLYYNSLRIFKLRQIINIENCNCKIWQIVNSRYKIHITSLVSESLNWVKNGF